MNNNNNDYINNDIYPEWASYTLGVFICLKCSGIHRNLPELSRVKSLQMGHWEETQVKFLAQHGNLVARGTYEALVPAYYYQPNQADCQVLREQWIRAKYERQEFSSPEQKLPYSNGQREGTLWKRGRDQAQYHPCRFLLSERDSCLKYFSKQDSREPKMTIQVDRINANFQPEKTGQAHGLQLTFLQDNRTRNLFVYHPDGKEIVDWFNSIRFVQLHYLKVAFPKARDDELRDRLTCSFLKEGYMEKRGPGRRWFTLDRRRLMYFKDPLDAFAKGEVFIGSREHGYDIRRGLPPGVPQGHGTWQHGLTLVTPDRHYLFACEMESEQNDWFSTFSRVIEKPMTPQDHASEHKGIRLSHVGGHSLNPHFTDEVTEAQRS
uniref:ArfGAP with dual PH domains 1 n=1 Tax=Ornithorhynchus anatinus TaxID=9258 RepID=A0A6I8PGE8_ORNAN